jgi:hypothetical protein
MVIGSAMAQEPLEIKGFQTGEVVNCTELRYLEKDSCWPDGNEMGGIFIHESFLGQERQEIFLHLRPDGILAGVVVASEEGTDSESSWTFEEAVAAFSNKYGEAHDNYSAIGQNSFGAKFAQKAAIWKDGNTELSIGSNISRIGEISISLTDDTLSVEKPISNDI